jgi:Na+-translocating ferredoxin:NAD+ oxidoreductase RnfC subunit
MEKPLLTRQEALNIGYSRYFTGKPCKHGHVAERYATSRQCVECNVVRWKNEPIERRRQYWKNYYTEEVKTRRTEKAKQRRNLNPYKRKRHRSEYKRRIRQATIKSRQDRIKVKAMYLKAQQMTIDSGIEYHIDHIIPLAHPDVCGLHTACNLQIILARENREKAQSFDPAEHEFVAEKS